MITKEQLKEYDDALEIVEKIDYSVLTLAVQFLDALDSLIIASGVGLNRYSQESWVIRTTSIDVRMGVVSFIDAGGNDCRDSVEYTLPMADFLMSVGSLAAREFAKIKKSINSRNKEEEQLRLDRIDKLEMELASLRRSLK